MKINIVSDLHLRQAPFALPDSDADLVILAGDVARPADAVAFALRIGKPTVLVAGNHEF